MEPNRKVKVRPVRREPPKQEATAAFISEFLGLLNKGEFDVFLDSLWKGIDDRLRVYFEEMDRDADDEQEERAEKVRRMRTSPKNLVAGNYYGIHGEKYSTVIVKYLGPVEESKKSDYPKSHVRVVIGTDSLPLGEYKIPTGALMVLEGRSQDSMRKLYEG